MGRVAEVTSYATASAAHHMKTEDLGLQRAGPPWTPPPPFFPASSTRTKNNRAPARAHLARRRRCCL